MQIMLGLVTHEPHFSLLREEVRFGKRANESRQNTPEAQTFHLLHISLLREYIYHEFESLKVNTENSSVVFSTDCDWLSICTFKRLCFCLTPCIPPNVQVYKPFIDNVLNMCVHVLYGDDKSPSFSNTSLV